MSKSKLKQNFDATVTEMERASGQHFKTARQAQQLNTRRTLKYLLEHDKQRARVLDGKHRGEPE